MGWFDPDPAAPFVLFEGGNGQRVPVARDEASLFGFDPSAFAPPPPVEPPPAPEPVPPPAAPEFTPPAAPGFAAFRPALPEGGASAFGQGALAPGVQDAPSASLPQFQAPPPVDLPPVPDAVSGGGPVDVPSAPSTSLPGVGFVPSKAATAPWVAPAPTGPQSMEDVDQRLADSKAMALAQAQQEAEHLAAAQEQKRAEEERQLAKQWADTQTAIKKAADYKVDPGRKWASMSTGKKIGAIVFAAISGLGSALKKQGDKNPALDIITAAINDDIALQMDERAQLGASAERSKQSWNQLGDMFKSKNAERAARTAAVWQRLDTEWSAAEAAAGSQAVKFRYADLRAGAQAQADANSRQAFLDEAELASKLAHEAAQTAKLQAETDKLNRRGGGGGVGGYGKGGAELSSSYTSLDQIAAIDKKLVQQAVLMPDGSFVIASSKEAKKEADDALVTSTQLVQNIDRALTKLTQTPGFAEKIKNRGGWTTEDVAVIQQELAQLQGSGKTYLGLGALSESDFNLMKQMGADVNSVTDFFEQAYPKLQNWRRGVVQDGAQKIRQYVSRDVDQETAFGAAPEKPRAKSSKEWTAQVTSAPTRDGSGAIVAAPNISDAEASLAGMRESWINEGRSDKEWQGEMGAMGARVRIQANNARSRATEIKKQIAALEKKGADTKGAKKGGDPWASNGGGTKAGANAEKIGALRQRLVEEAAAMANYEAIAKRIAAEKAKSLQGDIAKAKEKRAAAGRAERQQQRDIEIIRN